MKIATIVPNDYFAPWGFVKSCFKLSGQYFPIKEHQGCLVDKNRNYIWHEMKIENKDAPCDLLFIDSDIVFEPEDVATMEENLKYYDIVTGEYIIKAWDWELGIFEKINGSYEFAKGKEGIFEVEACGGAFLGISHRVINSDKMVKEPFSFMREGDVTHGEDVSFCQRAKEAGFKIFCDSSIKVGHIKQDVIRPGDKQPDTY